MRHATETLESARLRVRRFTAADLDMLAALLGDPVVSRHLGGARDRDGCEQTLRTRALDYYDRHPGLGMWVTEELTTGRAVGFHVLNHVQGEQAIQVGYALFQHAWGNGYATEMAVRLMHYGFEALALPQIVAITTLDNRPSQRVLEKCGLTRRGERTFTHPALAREGPMAWFEADRATWHGHGAQGAGLRTSGGDSPATRPAG